MNFGFTENQEENEEMKFLPVGKIIFIKFLYVVISSLTSIDLNIFNLFLQYLLHFVQINLKKFKRPKPRKDRLGSHKVSLISKKAVVTNTRTLPFSNKLFPCKSLTDQSVEKTNFL